jgi:hypothetical protein
MRARVLLPSLALLLPSLAGAQATFTPLETFTPFRTFTPIGTFTPIQSFTPVLTFTPIPTSTFPGPTVRPSRTATPSDTITPTATPTPTGPTPTGSASRTPTHTPLPSLTPTRFVYCVGDCSGDGVIVVNELIVGVLIAQDPSGLSLCSAFDRNGDLRVTVDELVAAVGLALTSCR